MSIVDYLDEKGNIVGYGVYIKGKILVNHPLQNGSAFFKTEADAKKAQKDFKRNAK